MLTGGRHPFGDNAITTQFNILQGIPANLHLVGHSPLAQDLIEWMLTSDVERRPSAYEVLFLHPYFWVLPDGCVDAERSANFVAKVAMTAPCRHPENYPGFFLYIHTYIHTHIHTHMHTYIHTFIHTYINTYTKMHACKHTYMHTHIQNGWRLRARPQRSFLGLRVIGRGRGR